MSRYLILEVGSGGSAAGTFLDINEHKEIRVRRHWPHFTWDRWASQKLSPRLVPSLVITAHPSLTHTRIQPFVLDRSQARYPLEIVEFENFLSRVVTNVLGAVREKAAHALRVDELHAILVGVRVLGLRADGRSVVHPLGLSPKKIEGTFELVFTTRELFDRWRRFFGAPGKFFLTSPPKAIMALLQKTAEPFPKLLYVDETQSWLFFRQEGSKDNAFKQTKLSWSPQPFLERIADRWEISPRAARLVYEAVVSGGVSEAVRHALEPEIRAHAERLADELDKKGAGRIFTASSLALPFTLPCSRPSYTLEAIEWPAIFRKLGFDVQAAPGVRDMPWFHLASCLEFYYDRHEDALHRWLATRVHWLSYS